MPQENNENSVNPAQQPEPAEKDSVATPSPEQQAPADTENPPANPENDAPQETRKDDFLLGVVKSIHSLMASLVEDKRKQQDEQERAINNFNIVNHGVIIGRDNMGDIVNSVNASVSPDSSPEEKSVKGTLEDILRSQDSVTRSALMMLAVLKYVPSDIFNEMTCDLCRRLTGDEELNVSFLWRAQDLLSGVPLTEGTQNPYLYAETATVWVGFQDAALADWTLALIWKEQRQLRKITLKWLFSLREREETFAERLTADMSMLSLTRLCSLDVAYAKEAVFPMLEQTFTNQRDIPYLVDFFQSFMRMDEACQKTANRILRRWSRDDLLWQVPYRLYGQARMSGEWDFQERTPSALYEKLESDIDAGKRGDVVEWFQRNRGHYLLPIHRTREEALTLRELRLNEAAEKINDEATERNEHSRALAALLIQQTGQVFASNRGHTNRRWATLFFLSLLRWDYLTDYSSKPQLVFLRCLQRKTLREQLLPMFQAICRPPFLDATAQILSSHMTEIQGHDDAYRNLEKSMLTLGKADYSGASALLRACGRDEDAAPVAARLRQALRQSREKKAD